MPKQTTTAEDLPSSSSSTATDRNKSATDRSKSPEEIVLTKSEGVFSYYKSKMDTIHIRYAKNRYLGIFHP